jgi:prepilin-type N-terminal cleavage/methylation domain-containing protein
MKMNKLSKRKAFTLIELLIVIAIIGILFIVLISKVNFTTNKSKATGVQTDFRSFQVAFETVSREHAGFNTFGWDTGDLNANGKRDSYDEGDTNKDNVQDSGEVWTGHKVPGETFTKVFTLVKPGTTFETDGYDADAIAKLETAINTNLDPKLYITIGTDGKITMANGAQDPWNTEYHGYYITNATVDKKDQGAIVMYSNGANNEFGSEHKIANGVVSISVPGNNKYGKDDYALAVVYTYTNGYGEVKTTTSGFNQIQTNIDNDSVNTPENVVELNEYGFCFDKWYVYEYSETEFNGGGILIVGFMFNENGTVTILEIVNQTDLIEALGGGGGFGFTTNWIYDEVNEKILIDSDKSL